MLAPGHGTRQTWLMMRFPIFTAASLSLACGACFTTSKELPLEEGSAEFQEDSSPVSTTVGSDIETPELKANAQSVETTPPSYSADEPPIPKKLSGDPEASMRESFSVGGMEALPELDQALSTNPGQLKPLMRGAFAGVGNDTDKCEEILLYLTVRHGHLAGELSSTAAEINPEIQSWSQ